MALEKDYLSEATLGAPISVVGTVTATADTVHTVPTGKVDEVTIYAINNGTAPVQLTIEMGQVTDPIVAQIQPKAGLTLVVPRLPLGAAKVVEAFAGTTAVIALYGDVVRDDA